MSTEVDGTSKGLLGGFGVFTLGSAIASLVYGVLLLIRYLGIQYNYGIFSLYATSIVLVAVGGLLILAVLLGVLGTLKDVSALRLVTLVLLFLAFVTLAVIGVWFMVSFKTGQLQRSIDFTIKNLNDNYGKLSNVDKLKADYLNKNYNCCGAYSSNTASGDSEGKPESCCIVPGCGTNPIGSGPKYYEQGCADVYFRTKSSVVFYVAILALASAGAVLLALIFFAVVSQRARGGYTTVSRK